MGEQGTSCHVTESQTRACCTLLWTSVHLAADFFKASRAAAARPHAQALSIQLCSRQHDSGPDLTLHLALLQSWASPCKVC